MRALWSEAVFDFSIFKSIFDFSKLDIYFCPFFIFRKYFWKFCSQISLSPPAFLQKKHILWIVKQLHHFNRFRSWINGPILDLFRQHRKSLFPFFCFRLFYNTYPVLVNPPTGCNCLTTNNVLVWIETNEYNRTMPHIHRQLHYTFVLTRTIVISVLVLVYFNN